MGIPFFFSPYALADAYQVINNQVINNDLKLDEASRITNTSVNGNTIITVLKKTSDPDYAVSISKSIFNGNVHIEAPIIPIYPDSWESASLAVVHSPNETSLNESIIKKDLILNVNDIETRNLVNYNQVIHGYSRNAALQIGHTDQRFRKDIEAPIRFIVEGKSNINLKKTQDIRADQTVRSAIGLNTPGLGSVLALAEQYDAEKHKIEPYKNKVFFGKESTIHTEADYSDGLSLASQAGDYVLLDGNQIYVNNKGKIQIDGKATAISAALYRINPVPIEPTPEEDIIKKSKIVDNIEINLLTAKDPGPSFMPHKVDPKLPGKDSAYILPSFLNNESFLKKDNIILNNLILKHSYDGLPRDYGLSVLKYLAHAKQHFDPNEKVIEVHNSGELLAPNGYVFSGSMFKDIFHSTAGKLAGKLTLNAGSDEVSLQGSDLKELIELNGAEDSGREKELKSTVKMGFPNYIELDDNIAYAYVNIDLPQAVNTLNLDQELTGSSTSTGQVEDTKIVNWDIINLGNNAVAKLNLTGDLNDGWDGLAVEENLRQKIFNIGSQGTLALNKNKTEATVSYNITNAGIIDLTQDAMTNNTLVVDGNYEGKNGKLLVNSQWNNPDNQQTDKLVVKGNASGTTTVQAPEGIQGDVTLQDKKIKNGGLNNPVVIVEGQDSGSFIGKASTLNAGEAQLVKTVVNGKSQYHWTLGINDNEIINKPSTGYVQSQAIARELGFMSLGRLNQRLGELTNYNKPQTWVRTRIEDDFLNGEQRFAVKSQRYLVQLGQDVAVWQDKAKHSRLGLTFSHAKANAKFFDEYHAENGVVLNDKFTTEAKLTALSVGGYYTQRYRNGAYIDLVGQLSHLKFNYLGEAQAKQKGYSLGASIEVGYPITLNSVWSFEPQAQLSYQHIRLSAFNDAQQRQIAKQASNNLRARVGMRLVANQQLYFATNLHYDLMGNQSKVTVGRSSLAEKYGRLTGEFSFGGKIDLSKNISINLEAHYKKNLSSGAVTLQNTRSPSEVGGQARLNVVF